MYSVLQWLIEKATVLKRLDPSDAVWAAFLCNLAYLHQIIIVLLLRLCYFYIFGLYWIKNMTFNMTAADGAFSPVTTSKDMLYTMPRYVIFHSFSWRNDKLLVTKLALCWVLYYL